MTVGSLDSGNSTLFPDSQQGSVMIRPNQYPYVFVACLHPHRHVPVPGYGDKRHSAQGGRTAGREGRDHLYPSKEQLLYAHLLQPITLLSDADCDCGFGIYAWQIFIAGGPFSSKFSANDPSAAVQGYNDYASPQSLYMSPAGRLRLVQVVSGSAGGELEVLSVPILTGWLSCRYTAPVLRKLESERPSCLVHGPLSISSSSRTVAEVSLTLPVAHPEIEDDVQR